MSASDGSPMQRSWRPSPSQAADRFQGRVGRRSLARLAGRALALGVGLAAMGLTAQHALAAATNGTITLHAKSADVGVGWTWGNGTLHWHGHNYPFTVKGLNVAAVGYSTVDAHGVVHNLKNLRDFDGTYASSTGSVTVDKGVEGEALVNGNGVQIDISGTTKGARLSGSVDGIKLQLAK